MPDLSSTNYLADSPSAISAAVTLDEQIGKLSRNENELWYGVKFDLANSSSPDGVRTGNMEMHKTLPIQSKMRGCTINNVDNVKKYLKQMIGLSGKMVRLQLKIAARFHLK